MYFNTSDYIEITGKEKYMFEVWYEMKSAIPPRNQNTNPEKYEKAF